MPSISPRPNLLSLRRTLPPILNLPPTSTGNNVPKSLHKTRRTWITNTHRLDQPVSILSADCAHKDKYGRGVLRGVKMRARDLKSFDKAGGVEGALLSQSPNNLTPFGKQLRAQLFTRLHSLSSGSISVSTPTSRSGSVFSLGMGGGR